MIERYFWIKVKLLFTYDADQHSLHRLLGWLVQLTAKKTKQSAIEKYTSLQILPPLFQSRAIQKFDQNGSILQATFLIFPDYLQKSTILRVQFWNKVWTFVAKHF